MLGHVHPSTRNKPLKRPTINFNPWPYKDITSPVKCNLDGLKRATRGYVRLMPPNYDTTAKPLCDRIESYLLYETPEKKRQRTTRAQATRRHRQNAQKTWRGFVQSYKRKKSGLNCLTMGLSHAMIAPSAGVKTFPKWKPLDSRETPDTKAERETP